MQQVVSSHVGRNKSAQFRHEPRATPLPKLRKALVRPTGKRSATARLVCLATLLLAGCNASVPATVAPPKAQPEASIPTEVAIYLPGMNAELQIL